MSVEGVLLARARPHMLAAKAQAIVQSEIIKGCLPQIYSQPVALEPPFQPILSPKDLLQEGIQPFAALDTPHRSQDWVRQRLWISPKQAFSWKRSEMFIKQMQSLSRRVGFEIFGNRQGVGLCMLCHREDLPVLKATFQSQFDQCEMSLLEDHPFRDMGSGGWSEVRFRDYFPPPPYSHLFSRPEEIHFSPLESIMTVLATVPVSAVGFYQVLLQPVEATNDWHRNVQVLLDFEYTMKLMGGLQFAQRYAMQSPSGDLRQMAGEVITKAHGDKAFFCAALRVGILGGGEQNQSLLRSLGTFSGLFQHGGRPLSYVTEQAYLQGFSADRIREIFLEGLVYRAGFLLNSWELTGLVHIPPAESFQTRGIPIQTLKTLPPQSDGLSQGTRIGTSLKGESQMPIHIPRNFREACTHIIGRPRQGKSLLMRQMILEDIGRQNEGVLVIDPHGDLAKSLPDYIPETAVDRTIYFDPGDPAWVPMWNVLDSAPGQDYGRIADDLVGSIKSVMTHWGDRLETFLRHAFYALLQIPHTSLLDVSTLLRSNSAESERLRKEILEVIDNETARQFWKEDFLKYRKEDLGPPQHKLSKLLVGSTVALMLSQPENRFHLRKIMDEGMILIADLSTIGTELRDLLGCFMLALLHLTALSRSDTPIEQRKPFHIYLDEAHRFTTHTLEDLLSEAPKYKVDICLAHQYLKQFSQKKADAFSGVGPTIAFNVDTHDAEHLIKDFRRRVIVDDLITLEVGEAICRIGNEIVRIETPKPTKAPKNNFRKRIIEQSRHRYYRPASEVRRTIRRRAVASALQPPHRSSHRKRRCAGGTGIR